MCGRAPSFYRKAKQAKPVKTAILQHDITDCAAACIASVARHYGEDIPISLIRETSGTSQAGTSIKGILDAAQAIGFRATGYKSDDKALDKLKDLKEPAILHVVNERGDLHFVVLYALTSRHARVMDPARGKMLRVAVSRLQEQWTGYLVTLSPDAAREGDRPHAQRPSLFSCFRQLSRQEFALMLAGSIVYIIAGVGTALFLQYIIDHVLPAGSRHALLQACLLMLAVMAFALTTGYGRIRYALRLSLQLDSHLILTYLTHLFRLPAGFFTRRGAGELHARIGDAAKVRHFLIEGTDSLLTSSLILFVSFTLMFTVHWRLSLFMLTFIPVYLVLYLVAHRVNKRVNRDIMEQSAVFEEKTIEGISAARTVRHFGQAEQVLRNIETEYRLLVRKLLQGGRWANGFATASDGIARLLTLTLLTAGSLYIFDGSLSIGALVSFYSLTAWFSAPLGELVKLNDSWNDARIAWERLDDINGLPPEEAGFGHFAPKAGEDLHFDRISFSYPGCPELLHDFSLTLKAGAITAIQGASGCGKSSLAALLMRDYAVQRGVIRLGPHDIRLFALDAWRSFISIVPQEPQLLNATLLENIAGFGPEPDIERVVQLLDSLQLGDFIRELPLGVFTRIGERGSTLSGGQRQRIALARALYRRPSVLILDEATSSLDEHARQCLLDEVVRFREQGGTVMMITHQRDNTAIADRTIQL